MPVGLERVDVGWCSAPFDQCCGITGRPQMAQRAERRTRFQKQYDCKPEHEYQGKGNSPIKRLGVMATNLQNGHADDFDT